MLESAWLFLGVLGILSLGAAVTTADDAVAIVAGTLGFVLWGVWTYGSLDVEVVADTTIHRFEMPTVSLVGLALAIVAGYIALTGPVELVSRVYDTDPEEI